MLNYDFESSVDRSATGSLKWEKYAGKDILPMWVADMDFRTAPEIQDALNERVQHGVFGYTLPPQTCVDAVMEYLRRDQDVEIKPEWIVWMPGLVPALNAASRAFGDPGDAVMTNTPVYPPFLTAPEWQSKKLFSVPLKRVGDEYTFDFAAMEAVITKSTRLFILCNPHNPVGRTFRRAELEELLAFCERHSLILISDEIHCDLIFNSEEGHHSILKFGDWTRDHSLTLMSPSKTYNIPGLACSFIIVPNARLRNQFQRASRGLITEVNCFGYAGCEAAYRRGEAWKTQLLGRLRANYEICFDFVRSELPQIEMLPMEATYLAWLDMRNLKLEQPDAHFEEFGLGLSNGAFFGFPGFLRLNFGCPESFLREGLERLKRGVQACRR